ncbi:hypothetical protein LOTGIDRAFT_232263 [Lottia gigantea]|uniref:Fibronectin type-III domain-containing protein n=1 Tax=Lottia gigantea TaxID=225164 RepID=V4AMG2_LOTGI|nr:hypothetical protein LOTGIDRAFT_232263 [Lottia gigantea]ESO94821.1 hypothetical protein LOTGIDRAFT_232263 [Lottia gigantea]
MNVIMNFGNFILLLLCIVYIDLYKPTFYVDGKAGDNCSGNDTSTCGSPSTPYVCKNDYCICDRKLFFEDDVGNCVEYKDPVPPSKVEIVDQTATNLTVTWTKLAEYPGPMAFVVEMFETERRDSEVADKTLYTAHIGKNAYNTTKYIHSNRIVGYWTYRAAVRVFLLNDESSNNSYSKQIRTPTAPAGTVHVFRVIILGHNHSDAKVWWRCPHEKERNGIITNYTVEIKLNVIRKFITWKQAKEADFNSPFLVTKGDWIKLSNNSEFSTFTAGNDDGCDEKPTEEICNGPLEPGTAYQAIAFSCTSVGCSYTYLGGSGWYRTQDKDRTIPIVAGILGTVAGLILIGVVIVLYKKGKLPCSSKQRPYSVTQTEHKDRTIPIVAGILGTVAGLILIGVVIVLYKKGKLPCSSKQRPYSVTQTELFSQ